MTWAKAVLVVGSVVLLAGFAIGTEDDLTTPVSGKVRDCGPSISASWLVPGTPDQAQPGPAATDDEQRVAAACSPVIHESRVLVVALMGLGGLLALAGWTALSTPGAAVHRTVTSARA